MKTDKNISIKVKSKTERRIMEEPELEMISDWNFKKIAYALIVLILFVILPAYYFSSQDNSDPEKTPPIEMQVVNQATVKQGSLEKTALESSSKSAITEPEPVQVISSTVEAEETVSVVAQAPTKEIISTQPTAQITAKLPTEKIAKQNVQEEQVIESVIQSTDLNPYIARAQLAQGVNKLEPYGNIDLPILVDSSKAYGVTYFTEVINMQGDTVFHEWLKEGHSVYKRKINIRGNRWRISTSKLFPYNSIGQWQVRTIAQQGNILHKIDFSVQKR